MTGDLDGMEEGTSGKERRKKGLLRGRSNWTRALVIIPVLLLLSIIAALAWLDSDSGHDFIEREVAALEPANGLRIRIGDIDGSIYSKAVIRDLQLSDPEGVFFEASEVGLDWFIFAFFVNRLSIDELVVDEAELFRLPEFIDTGRDGPILPGFDIVIDELRVGAIRIDEAITGREMTLSLTGNAEILSGRAIVSLRALTTAGDRVVVDVDAEPDGDRFGIVANIEAPDDGLLPAIAGFDSGFSLNVDGQGTWSDWTGQLLATYAGNPAATLDIAMTDGDWRATGRLNRPAFLSGLVERVVGDAAEIDLAGTFDGGVVSLSGEIETANLATRIDGGIDLADRAVDDLQFLVRRLNINALLADARAESVTGQVRLNGPFDAMQIGYSAKAPELYIGDTGFQNLTVEGSGLSFGDVVRIPVTLRARQVIGTGELAEQALSNLAVDGALIIDGDRLTGDDLVLTTDQIDARIAAVADLRRGQYDVAAKGVISNFDIRNFGRVDLDADVRIRPDNAGNLTLAGVIRADMDRLDVGFLRTVAGGLPRLDTDISLGADNRFRFTDFTLRSPKFTFRGDGVRNADGLFDISGTGTHSDYGPLDMTLTGAIDRPRVALTLESPVPAAGLADVEVLLDPNENGFAVTSQGQSYAGPFDLNGQILLPPGQRGSLRVDVLNVAGSTAAGTIDFADDGFVGMLDVGGGALSGTVTLGTDQGAQTVNAALEINGLNAPTAPQLSIRRGRIDADVRLEEEGSDIDATVEAFGVRGAGLALGRLSLKADVANGAGQIAASVEGTRGSSFEFDALADVAPGRIEIVGDGSFRNRPLELSRPILLEKDGDAWVLRPSELGYGGGKLLVGGRFGGDETLAAVEVEDFPLALFDVGDSNLGLSGTASGIASYSDGSGPPTAEMHLQVRRFSRSGLYLTSTPIDLAVNAKLDPEQLGVRAVVNDGSSELGRMQAKIDNMPTGPDLVARILGGDLFAQLRYDGPATALWRLAGVELFDLQGQMNVGADANGTLADPAIRGIVSSREARLESASTGTVITDIDMLGHFDGSRLTFDRISGSTARGGSVSGTGSILLSASAGPFIDLDFNARRALLLDRDDFSAQVTGPLSMLSDGKGGGTISGDFKLDYATFELGNASAAEALPNVRVVEINGRADNPESRVVSSPWTLDVSARANNEVYVSGLGLESEWAADLDIMGPVDEFRLLGEARLIRGEYEFAGKTFELTRGEIGFVGAETINPTLDIAASAEVEGIDATVTVTGRGQAPQIAFSSNPALPQEELLSRILFGTSITDLSAAEALQLGAAVASLQDDGGGSLDPINAVRRAAGLDRLRIVGADEEVGSGTAIAAGKYITDNTYVELVTDGRGYSATQVEYRITRWLSLLSSISTLGRQQVSVRVSKDY